MSSGKLIGIILLVAGVGLIIWGNQMSGSVGSQISEAFSGSPPDEVMYRYIGGAVLAAAGAFFLMKK